MLIAVFITEMVILHKYVYLLLLLLLDLSVPLKCWEMAMGSNLTQESSGNHSKVQCFDVVMGSSGYLLLLKSNDMHIASIKAMSVSYSSVF